MPWARVADDGQCCIHPLNHPIVSGQDPVVVILPLEEGIVDVGDTSLPGSDVPHNLVPVLREAPPLLLQGPDTGHFFFFFFFFLVFIFSSLGLLILTSSPRWEVVEWGSLPSSLYCRVSLCDWGLLSPRTISCAGPLFGLVCTGALGRRLLDLGSHSFTVDRFPWSVHHTISAASPSSPH